MEGRLRLWRVFVLTLGLCLVCPSSRSEIIAAWGFNGTEIPSQGNGTAWLRGGTSVAFATGSPTDSATNNKAWNTASYPAQGTSNKTAGVEFRVSTQGYSDILLNWEQRVSASASKYFRLQYSADGETFADLPGGVIESAAALAFEQRGISLAGVQGAADNPLFAFRILSEFESTATGAGTAEYVCTSDTNTYARSGTVRFDLVRISGTRLPGANIPPTISPPGEVTLRVGQRSAPLAFTVGDFEDPADALLVTSECADPQVIAESILIGEGASRAVVITAGAVPGKASVSLTVRDTGGCSNSTSASVTVLPANTAPFLSAIAGTNLVCGSAPAPIEFQVGDLETPAESLLLSGSSGNSRIVPNDEAHLSFAGSGTNRMVLIRPESLQAGIAPITVTVSDGQLVSSSSFYLLLRPSATLLLGESFEYGDGSLCTNSGGLWRNRSGTPGNCLVRKGQLELTGSRDEDVITTLAGAPYTLSNAAVIYASFRFKFAGSPKAMPEYFAHLLCGNSLRARVYAGATDIWPGAFRLYVANGSDTHTVVPWNLSTNTFYRVVTRYEVDTARTTLWLNPRAETEPGTTATDAAQPQAANGYGFRQDSGLGTGLWVDDLRVGLTFAAVTDEISAGASLSLRREGDHVILNWTLDTYELQAADAPTGPFVKVESSARPHTNFIRGPGMFFRLKRTP